MRALIDLNILFAVTNEWHEHHDICRKWLKQQAAGSVVINRIVQLGLLRLLNTSSAMREKPLKMPACWQAWDKLSADQRLVLQLHEPSHLDAALRGFTKNDTISPKVWADAYLAAFAWAAGYKVVTLDNGFTKFNDLPVDYLS